MRAWTAWSTGDIAGALNANDEAAAHDAVDPAFWFHNIAAYVHHGDGERTAQRTMALRDTAATDDRRAFFAALVQPFDLARTPDLADQALAWADRALEIASAAHFPSGIANSRHFQGLALRHTDPISARAAFEDAMKIASTVRHDHLIVHGGLSNLAQVTTRSGDIGDALRCCHDAIASAARHRFSSSIAVTLQYGVVALSRAGDPDTAAALVGCLRAHGYRVWQNTQSELDDALGGRVGDRPAPPSMLDAAELALAAIKALL